MIEAAKRQEDEMIKQAMEMSLRHEQEVQNQISQEEEEIMKRVMEISEREEKERQEKIQTEEKAKAQVQLQPQAEP